MINAVEKFFGRFSFIPYRSAKAAEVDPEIFSHLQLHIAAHPDIETSCVLANLFRAIYMDSSLFYAESLERLDATSRSLARDLMRAKLLKAFSPEEWDEAHRLISQLPPERGGIGTAGPRESGAIFAALAVPEMEVSTTQSPAIGSSAWVKAWFEYFKSLARRRAAVVFARASQKGGFDGFKYLWGAPAAATVIAAFFGVALLDERLGLRRVIVSSPPVQWIAELIETETQAEPVIEAQVENASIARLQPKATPKRVPVERKASKVDDAAISWQSGELAQHIATGNQPISESASLAALDASGAVVGLYKGEDDFAVRLTALDASEGVAGRIARPETASSQERPKILVPREGNRPEQQTRPKPVVTLKPPVVIIPPDQVAPPPVSALPLIAKVVETVQPVLHDVQSDLPKTPLLEELPPVTNAAGRQGTKSGAATVEMPELTPARSLDTGVGTEQAAAPAFIQRLQSGGRDERKDDAKHAINRRGERVESVNRNRVSDFVEQLDRSGPSDRVERVDRSGPGDGLERVEQLDRSGPGDRVERIDRLDPSDRVDRVERVDRSGPGDRVERVDRSGPGDGLERAERVDRSGPGDRVERVDRSGPSDRVERVERVARSGPVDRVERIDRSGPSARLDRVERIDRSGPGDRVERADRSGPSNRAERFERIDRSGKSGRGG